MRDIQQMMTGVREAYARRSEILADRSLYDMCIPGCESGDCYVGPMKFTAGVMLECWEKCPCFTLPDGGKICQFGGSVLSGSCSGWAFNPATQQFRSFRNEVSQLQLVKAVREILHRGQPK